MNLRLLGASLLALFTALVHAFAGGRDVVAPLMQADLERSVAATLLAVWHMVTLVLLASAYSFYLGAKKRRAFAARLWVRATAVLWCGFGAVFLGVCLWFPGNRSLWFLPQWVLLLPVGMLAWWGSFDAVPGAASSAIKKRE